MQKISTICLIIFSLSACTHKNVAVDQLGDSKLSCSQLGEQIIDLKILKKDIDDKTGVSGRNAAMLLFWPGILVNEYNASDAHDRADQRSSKLIALFEKKSCDDSSIRAAEKKLKAEAEEKKEANKGTQKNRKKNNKN